MKPKKPELVALLKEVESTLNRSDRLVVLRKIAAWYITSCSLKGTAVTTDSTFKRAVKTCDRGMLPSTPAEEAETAMLVGIKLFEKIWNSIDPPAVNEKKRATLAEAMEVLATESARLAAIEQALQAKYVPYLGFVNQVFAEFGFRYEVHKQERARIVNARDRVVRVSREYAGECLDDVKRHPTAVIFRELTPVIRALSLVDRLGTFEIDLKLVNENMAKVHEVCSRLLDPAKIPAVPAHVAAPANVSAPVTPRAPRATRTASAAPANTQPYSGVKPLFRPGTMTDKLYQRLVSLCGADFSCDVQSDELFKGLSSGDPNALLNDLVRKGKQTNAFVITRYKNGYLKFERPMV